MSGEHDRSGALIAELVAFGRELSETDGPKAMQQRIVDRAQDLLECCDGVSLMLVSRRGAIETPAASSRVAYDSDLAQYATGQGPCLSCIHDRETVVDDLETDDRWPAYRLRALPLGVRCVLSVRLFVSDDSLGALNLHASRPHAFDERALVVVQALAGQASVTLKAALVESGLQAAVRSRDVIGQAKGIVMARRHLTAGAAYEVLKQHSQATHRKLVDIAEQIVTTGELPPAAGAELAGTTGEVADHHLERDRARCATEDADRQAPSADDELLRAFLDVSEGLLCAIDPEGRFVAVNDAWTALLGWGREELLGRHYLDLVHVDDVEVTRALATDIVDGHPVAWFETRYRHYDGSYRWLRWNTTCLAEDGRCFALLCDVTGAAGQLAMVSLLNLPAGSATAQGYPGSSAGDERACAWDVEVVRPDSHRVSVLIRRLLDRDRAPSPRPALTTAVDAGTCTPTRRAEAAGPSGPPVTPPAIAATEELIATVSHELRTPLAALYGAIQTLSRTFERDLPAPGPELLGMAERNVTRLRRLVEELLEVRQTSSLEPPAQLELLALRDLVARSLGDNAPLAAEEGTSFLLGHCDPVVIKADPHRLEQVLANLLSNAARFAPEGSSVVVDVRATPPRADRTRQVRVEVVDHGPGIPIQLRDRLFERFCRADAAEGHSTGGTGLGLAIVRDIIEAHGGTVGADSAPGRTAVWFELPVAEEPSGR